MSKYEHALSIIDELDKKGESVDELCLANEFRESIKEACITFIKRSKLLKKQLDSDIDELFSLSIKMHKTVSPVMTHRATARAIVACYFSCKMDMTMTEAMTKNPEFVKFIPNL